MPKLFQVNGKCNIGQLEYRHIFVRFDLFEDFAKVVSRSSGYVQSRGEDFFFKTFPWTMGFNPREETSKAVVWISLPNLPANLFASKSLLCIASAVGKPIAVDKATKDRTRPSTARVKVLINLLDNHPKKIKIKILDTKSGKMIENDQQIIFDSLPKYCTLCSHQGHDINSCWWNMDGSNDTVAYPTDHEGSYSMSASGCDAREFLNEIRARSRPGSLSLFAKHNSTNYVHASIPLGAKLLPLSNNIAQNGQPSFKSNHREQKVWKPVADAQYKVAAPSVRPHIPNDLNKNASDIVKTTKDTVLNKNASDIVKATKDTVSLREISFTDFDISLFNSSYEIGSIFGVKLTHALQKSTADGDIDLDSVGCQEKQSRQQIQANGNAKTKRVMDNSVFPDVSVVKEDKLHAVVNKVFLDTPESVNCQAVSRADYCLFEPSNPEKLNAMLSKGVLAQQNAILCTDNRELITHQIGHIQNAQAPSLTEIQRMGRSMKDNFTDSNGKS